MKTAYYNISGVALDFSDWYDRWVLISPKSPVLDEFGIKVSTPTISCNNMYKLSANTYYVKAGAAYTLYFYSQSTCGGAVSANATYQPSQNGITYNNKYINANYSIPVTNTYTTPFGAGKTAVTYATSYTNVHNIEKYTQVRSSDLTTLTTTVTMNLPEDKQEVKYYAISKLCVLKKLILIIRTEVF